MPTTPPNTTRAGFAPLLLLLLLLPALACDDTGPNNPTADAAPPAPDAANDTPDATPPDATPSQCEQLNACACPSPPCPADPPWHTPPITVAPSEDLPPEVISQPAHNNLDLIWHADRLFFAFRTAPNHYASALTRLYVVSTDDHQTWRFEADLHYDTDLREPRFLSYNGRLWLYFARLGTSSAAFEPGDTLVTEWEGPGRFTPPQLAFGDGFIPWRFIVRDGIAWLSGYDGGENIYQPDGDPLNVYLLRSEDGETWDPVGDPAVLTGGVSETAITFHPDGRLIAVGRNEAGDEQGFGSRICTAPAHDPGRWTCAEDPRKYDSPLLITQDDIIWLIARRQVANDGHYDLGNHDLPKAQQWARNQASYWNTPKRCALWRIDPETRTATHALDFPTAGDTCFASAIPLGQGQWLIYDYTAPLDRPEIGWRQAQGGPTHIYRTTLQLPTR